MEQNTKKWLQWRKQGIGGSDVPVIFGISEYKTPFQLFQEKTMRGIEDNKPSFIAQKGHDMEPIAREKFNIFMNKDFKPKLVQRRGGPFRVSLDGIDGDDIIEIKYCGKNFRDEIPEGHMLQMQYQLLVSDAIKCWYVQIKDSTDIKFTEVVPDDMMIKDIKKTVLDFWEKVQNKISPPMSKDDILPINDGYKKKALRKYAALKKKADKIEEEMEVCKKQILAGLEKTSYQHGNLKITYSERIGSVDYSKVKELEGVNLEPYRKPTTGSHAIKVLKDGKTT